MLFTGSTNSNPYLFTANWSGTGSTANINTYFINLEEEDPNPLTPEEIKQIEESIKELAEGKYTEYTVEEYLKHLESLIKEEE